ncbi:MAG: flagellar type III secretion system pore protein FliP [Acidimicrobiales bacterium]
MSGSRPRLMAFAAVVLVGWLALGQASIASAQTDADDPSDITDTPTGIDLDEPIDVAPASDVEPTTPDPGSPLQAPTPPVVGGPDGPENTEGGTTEDSAISIVVIITALTLVPTVLIMATSFTRIVIVLGLTRNALGLQGVPPNQVLIGLALFLTLFVMGPTLSEANDAALQPYLDGELSFSEAYDLGVEPFRDFMLAQVREEDLSMFIDLSGEPAPTQADDVPLTTLAPAFLVSELRAAFIIGFIIFVPFLVVDMIVSATLMSMGMVMLPPVVISLPFKILLFVMVDGWFLLVPTLVRSFEL